MNIGRSGRMPGMRILFLLMLTFTSYAGTVEQVGHFLTWDGNPQVVASSDAAGICYSPVLGHLMISDSEINEESSIFNDENIFEVNFLGNTLYNTYLTTSSNIEPTGIAYSLYDGYYYVSNDNRNKVYRYSIVGGIFTKITSWPLDSSPNRWGGDDVEGVTVNPANGHIFIANGEYHGNMGILEFDVNGGSAVLINGRAFSSSEIKDPEGIAYHPGSNHLFIVSSPDMAIFEYDLSGNYVDEYDISGLSPTPYAPQGIGFGPSSDNGSLQSLYIADGGIDNNSSGDWKDGEVYEVRFPDLSLPVELMAFNVDTENGMAVLSWSTASEFENMFWVIERSEDGENFYEIDRVDGHGTTTEANEYVYYDESVEGGRTYVYRLTDIALNGQRTVHEASSVEIPVPKLFTLGHNYPNPFNPATTIPYQLKEDGRVTLSIYDIQGRKVRAVLKSDAQAGEYTARWDGRNEYGNLVSSGMYIYVLRLRTADGRVQQKVERMILAR